MTDLIVKKCTSCQALLTAGGIVYDPVIKPIGTAYLEDESMDTHFFVFQHDIPNCGTSFAVDVEKFRPFIAEPIPIDVMRLGPRCEGHCVNIDDHKECTQDCHFAPFRRFLLKMIAIKSAATVKARVV